MKKKSVFLVSTLVVLVIIAAAFSLKIAENVRLSDISPGTTSPATTETSSENNCSSDVNGLADVPPLNPDFSWQIIISPTSGHSPNWASVTSTDSGKVTFLPAIEVGDGFRMTPLTGKGWSASYTYSSENWEKFWNYYQGELKKRGWSREVDSAGYKIRGTSADGPNGGETGYVKMQNDSIRTVVLSYSSQQGARYFGVFVSDITPLSQIIPGYKPSCGQ